MLARERGLSLPLAEATKGRYDEIVRLGLGESDKSVIAELTFPGRVGAGA
jgi:3-hydroxyisobutyrate dehydrogenase